MNKVLEDVRTRVKLGQEAGVSDTQILLTEIELLSLHVDAIEKALKESKCLAKKAKRNCSIVGTGIQ